jgi:hypothetical protein
MVKPAQDWQGKDTSYALGVVRNRRFLLQRKVRTALVVILSISVEQMTEMLLAEDHPPSIDRAAPAVVLAIVPQGSRCLHDE